MLSNHQKPLLYATVAAVIAGLIICSSSVGTPKSAVRGGVNGASRGSRTLSRDVQIEGRELPHPNTDAKTLHSQNPYASSLDVSLGEVATRASSWLNELPHHLTRANTEENKHYGHHRFFPFDPLAQCKSKSCIGGDCGADESKIVCGLEALQDPACVVYSIGGNNWWGFELDLLKKTKCEIHTFDCTGALGRFHKPENDRLKFHHVCLSDQYVPPPKDCEMSQVGGGNGYPICGAMAPIQHIQRSLGHDRIDLLKMDIEGFEWPIFESWPTVDEPSASDTVLPMQILVEVHYRTFPHFADLIDGKNANPGPHINTPNAGDFRNAEDLVRLEERLVKMGYAPVVRDDNQYCPHCTELTLVRHTVPSLMMH